MRLPDTLRRWTDGTQRVPLQIVYSRMFFLIEPYAIEVFVLSLNRRFLCEPLRQVDDLSKKDASATPLQQCMWLIVLQHVKMLASQHLVKTCA